MVLEFCLYSFREHLHLSWKCLSCCWIYCSKPHSTHAVWYLASACSTQQKNSECQWRRNTGQNWELLDMPSNAPTQSAAPWHATCFKRLRESFTHRWEAKAISVYIPTCHKKMHVSFCAVIQNSTENSSETTHNKVCELSWVTWSWSLERDCANELFIYFILFFTVLYWSFVQ